MATAFEILEIIAPLLAADPRAPQFISLATACTNPCSFGDKYQYAIALRAAHMMTMSTRAGGGGDSGMVTQKKEGELSISFGATAGSDGDLGQTGFGVQLQGLIKGNILAMGVTGACGGISYCD